MAYDDRPGPADRSRSRVVLVAAVARNGVIGAGGELPWRLPAEMAHFKALTTGHVVVMGRTTFESIGRPLPRRTNIVVTRQPGWTADGVVVAHDVAEALATGSSYARDLGCDVMVIGGAQVYAAALALADEQVVSEVHLEPEGDVRYPDFDRTDWVEVSRKPRDGFDVVTWRRCR